MAFNGSGWTDVHHYAANGDVDRLRQLDDSELTKTTVVLKQTAMHIAVLKNQSQVVNYLIERCPTMIAEEDANNQNALYCAVFHKQTYLVGKLAACFPHLIDKPSSNTLSPIEYAVRENYMACTAAMLVHNPDVARTFLTIEQKTLLHIAVEMCDINMVEFVLALIPQSLVIAQNESGWTALHDAINCGLKMVQLVYSANPAAVHIYNSDHETPVLMAGDHGDNAAILDYFLRVAPSSVEHSYSNGCSLLHYAPNVDVAKTIVKLKPTLIDSQNNDGNTPLHLAVRDVVSFLLTCKPSLVYVKNNDGLTPLHYANQMSDFELAHAILSFKPNLVDTNHNGTTVLHVALSIDGDGLFNGDGLLAQVFCNHMSNLYCKNAEGNTPYHLALELRHDYAIQLFKKHLTIDMMVETDTFNDTPFLVACLSVHLLPELVDIVFASIGIEQTNKPKKRRIEE